MDLDINKHMLINHAVDLHNDIYPCKSKSSLMDCFTEESGILYFWFNTIDNSTHLLKMLIEYNRIQS